MVKQVINQCLIFAKKKSKVLSNFHTLAMSTSLNIEISKDVFTALTLLCECGYFVESNVRISSKRAW